MIDGVARRCVGVTLLERQTDLAREFRVDAERGRQSACAAICLGLAQTALDTRVELAWLHPAAPFNAPRSSSTSGTLRAKDGEKSVRQDAAYTVCPDALPLA